MTIIVRSEEINPPSTSCELIEVTTSLFCFSADPNLAVQIKMGIERLFADLSKAPYKSSFNPTTSGARAFNATVVQRAINSWIEKKKQGLSKKSSTSWRALVHGNRILAAAVFRRFDAAKLSQPIGAFPATFKQSDVDSQCEMAYKKIVDAIQAYYANKFLAVLFKNPTMSKHVFDLAVA